MFTTIAASFNKTLVATLVTGVLLAGVHGKAHAGGEGGGNDEDVTFISMTHPNGTVDTLRGNKDGSRTFTRKKNGKVIKKQVIRKKKKVRRPGRSKKPMISMTNPDGSRVTVTRNRDGSRTTRHIDRNGNVTRQSTRGNMPRGMWSASGVNHTTGRSGLVIGNASGTVFSTFGIGF